MTKNKLDNKCLSPKFMVGNKYKTALEKTQLAWGGELPEWIKDLAIKIDEVGNQRQVAEAIGYSSAALSSVINNNYSAPLDTIEKSARSYLNLGVNRMGTFRSTNPLLVRATRSLIKKGKVRKNVH